MAPADEHPDQQRAASDEPAADSDATQQRQELSFEALSRSFAQLVGPADDDSPENQFPGAARDEDGEQTEPHEFRNDPPTAATDVDDDDACEISPKTILEAVLFVGHPDNNPITARQAAALMRGVSPAEVDQLVVELNTAYDQQARPYRIESVGAGYRMAIRDEFARLRDKFYGRVREARLSQAAIDVLAIVAYNQPLAREEIEKLRGKSCGGVLSQLVRRHLLKMERPQDRPSKPKYCTTSRFLQLFGLESLQDLPQSQDLERVM